MATTIATKTMTELIKEAWRAKAKVAAQKTKSGQTAKKLKQLASSTTKILSFDDWQFKRLFEKHNKVQDNNNSSSEAMKKLSDHLHSSGDEITNPTVRFINQMIFENPPQQATEAEEILAQDKSALKLMASSLKIGTHLWMK